MKNKPFSKITFIKKLPLVISILFVVLLMTNPVNSISLVKIGLTTWYKNMIPSLFPFMVLSGFLLRSGLSGQMTQILYPVLGRLFRLSPNCIYVIVMGFICGFPMGANVIADSLNLGKITRKEAELLLAFCNNIGPMYVVSFVSVLCPYYPLGITLSIMYGIPFIYGLFLRYTIYKDIPYRNYRELTCKVPGYLESFQESLQKALISIIILGGYMIIFNVLQLPLYNTFYKLPEKILCLAKGIIEINSGIFLISSYPELYGIVYTFFLPFCGLCCFFQTYAMIKDTPLSLKMHLFHKIMQSFFTFFAYLLLVSFI